LAGTLAPIGKPAFGNRPSLGDQKSALFQGNVEHITGIMRAEIDTVDVARELPSQAHSHWVESLQQEYP
jgi:hypothetical protein